MIPYFIIYFLLTLFCIVGALTKNRFFLLLIFLILTFFSGLRFHVGVDYDNYVNIFNDADGYASRELGFSLFLEFLHLIGADFQMLFLFSAIMMQYLVYKILIRYDYDVWTSVLIYYCISPFYIATFNGMRQYLAIAVFILALRYIEEQKLWKYVCALLMAAFFFHLSVLCFIPLYFILNKRITFIKKIWITGGTVVFSYMLDKIIAFTPYMVYLFRDRETHISSFTYIFAIIALLLMIIWRKFPNFPHKLLLSNMNLFCMLSLIIVFLQTNGVMIQMMLRMNSYFFFIYILLVPAIISSIRNNYIRYSSYAVLHLILLIYLVRTIVINGAMYDLVPYSINTYFFK